MIDYENKIVFGVKVKEILPLLSKKKIDLETFLNYKYKYDIIHNSNAMEEDINNYVVGICVYSEDGLNNPTWKDFNYTTTKGKSFVEKVMDDKQCAKILLEIFVYSKPKYYFCTCIY